jgi:uncharacterized protein YjiS (DUF1127 family)
MLYDTSFNHRSRRTNLLMIAYQSWRMFSNLLERRRTYAKLSNLDDRLLKDIGISPGNIRSAIRNGRPDYSI